MLKVANLLLSSSAINRKGAAIMHGLIEWERMPRGTYRATVGDIQIDVWRMGGGIWKWTVYESSEGVYLASGESPSLDSACDDSLIAAQI